MQVPNGMQTCILGDHRFESSRGFLVVFFFRLFFTRHVSDKDRQSKLYRNVQPVFSIDDEDEDGGIDFSV